MQLSNKINPSVIFEPGHGKNQKSKIPERFNETCDYRSMIDSRDVE